MRHDRCVQRQLRAIRRIRVLVAEAGFPKQDARRMPDEEARRHQGARMPVVFAGVGEWREIGYLQAPAIDGVKPYRWSIGRARGGCRS
jgi:hypothetical protein